MLSIITNQTNGVMVFFIGFLVATLLLILLQNDPVFAVFIFIIFVLMCFTLLLICNYEFFALLILIIYIGVITVLFLFIVIMYELRSIHLNLATLFLNPFTFLFISKIWWLSLLIVPGLTQHHSTTRAVVSIFDLIHFIVLFNEHYILLLFCGLLIFVIIMGDALIKAIEMIFVFLFSIYDSR